MHLSSRLEYCRVLSLEQMSWDTTLYYVNCLYHRREESIPFLHAHPSVAVSLKALIHWAEWKSCLVDTTV
jgi:hypothetical protein